MAQKFLHGPGVLAGVEQQCRRCRRRSSVRNNRVFSVDSTDVLTWEGIDQTACRKISIAMNMSRSLFVVRHKRNMQAELRVAAEGTCKQRR